MLKKRWIRSARHECLDHLLILGERRLHRTLMTYCLFYYERHQPQGLQQQWTVPLAPGCGGGRIARRDVLSWIIYDYHREAA